MPRAKKPEAAEKPPSELQGVFKAANKRYGEGTVHKASKTVQPNRISTGSFILDLALLGGIPEKRVTTIIGERHGGKAGRSTDKVLTPKGWVMYKNISAGEYAIGADGTPTEILGVHPRGVLPMYKVSFTDKSTVVVAGDHLWHVTTRKQAHTTKNYYVMSTEDLLKTGLRDPRSNMAKYRIPMVAPVQYEKKELPIEPYTMGVLLANGYLERAMFSTNDIGVVDEVRKRNCKLYTLEQYPTPCRQWLLTRNDGHKGSTANRVRTYLDNLGLLEVTSRHKYIPEEYLRSCVQDRIDILNGLMDCDGTTVYPEQKNAKHYAGARYCTRSCKLAKGVQELVNSLGGTASISKTIHSKDGGTDYTISIMLPTNINTFRGCAKKVEAYESRKRREPVRSIASIVPEGECDAICISVAAEDHLYVTEDHIVTHNSMLASMITGSAQRKYPDKSAVLLDVEDTAEPVWMRKLGVDIDKLYIAACETGEMAVDMGVAIAQAKETSLLVVDSIAALTPIKEIESSAEDSAIVAQQARLVNTFLRRIVSAIMSERKRGHDVTLVLLNQFRCLDKSTRVWTDTGLCTMEDLKPGDRVASPSGYSFVKAKVDTGLVKGVKISIKNHAPLCMSLNHRHIVVQAEGAHKEVLASDIDVGDWVVLSTEADMPYSEARGKYDAVPYSMSSAIFEEICRKASEAHRLPEYHAIYMSVRKGLSASRERMLRFAKAASAIVFDIDHWIPALRDYRYAEITAMTNIGNIDAVDIEVEGGLFYADGVLTHNSKIGGFAGFGEPRTMPGGRLLEATASLQLTMKNKENKGKNSLGVETVTDNEHAYTITKNKINGGPRTGEFVMLREDDETKGLKAGQVDDSSTLLSYAKRFKVYTGEGAAPKIIDIPDYTRKYRINDEAVADLRSDKALYWALRTHIIRLQARHQGMPEEFIERIT